jgi:hypothetical protein
MPWLVIRARVTWCQDSAACGSCGSRQRGRKSGAFRVIYYVPTEERPILALLLHGKNEQVNPTPEQARVIAAVVAEFRAAPHEGTTRRRSGNRN